MKLFRTKTFKKEYTRLKMTDKQHERYLEFISSLLRGEELPSQAKDHKLIGNFNEFRELHISGDLLIIYSIEKDILKLVRIGTHNECTYWISAE